MGATEEQMALLAAAHITHVSYILILYSMAFLLYLCMYTIPQPSNLTALVVNILLHLYAVNVPPSGGRKSKGSSSSGRGKHQPLTSDVNPDAEPYADTDDIELQQQDKAGGSAGANGNIHGRGLGVSMTDQERTQVRDAQDFELDALISDDEEDVRKPTASAVRL